MKAKIIRRGDQKKFKKESILSLVVEPFFSRILPFVTVNFLGEGGWMFTENP